MLDELKTAKKIVGYKQSIKAVEAGIVKKAFVAKDADAKVTDQFEYFCKEHAVSIEYVESMKDLGKACGIDVGASVAVITC